MTKELEQAIAEALLLLLDHAAHKPSVERHNKVRERLRIARHEASKEFKPMIPEFTREATHKDLLDPAMDIAIRGDHEEATKYVNFYVAYLINSWHHSPEKAHDIVMSNLGYYAGYFDTETRKAVKEVFGASHPVLGDRYELTVEELFDAGFQYMQGIKP